MTVSLASLSTLSGSATKERESVSQSAIVGARAQAGEWERERESWRARAGERESEKANERAGKRMRVR